MSEPMSTDTERSGLADVSHNRPVITSGEEMMTTIRALQAEVERLTAANAVLGLTLDAIAQQDCECYGEGPDAHVCPACIAGDDDIMRASARGVEWLEQACIDSERAEIAESRLAEIADDLTQLREHMASGALRRSITRIINAARTLTGGHDDGHVS